MNAERISACGMMYETAIFSTIIGVGGYSVLKCRIIRIHNRVGSRSAYVHTGKVRHKIVPHKKEHEDVVIYQMFFYNGAYWACTYRVGIGFG